MSHNRPKTILVVEDNQAMNLAICDILELNQYTVISACDGVDGLSQMRRQRPDVVLCDIMMPRMDGYTLLQNARSDELLRTVPFIFLTARSSTQDKRHAKGIGIDDYLVKPVDAQDLLLAVSNVLRREEYLVVQAERQLDQLRNQIIAALQHEFRTPLTFILGYAELLAESPPETVDVDTLRASTNAIWEGGRRLQNMIEKFLLLADMQYRRELPDSVSSINPLNVLATQAKVQHEAAQKAGLSFRLTSDVTEPSVLAEPTYLHEAVGRMVENAIQYRRAGSRQIHLAVVVIEGYIGLRVADDGQGIPAEQLARLRNPFEQVDRDNRVLPGIGLGLAQVRHIARLHGGHLQIESSEGVGSTFTLWLPLPPKTA